MSKQEQKQDNKPEQKQEQKQDNKPEQALDAKVTNNYSSPICLNGVTIAPNATETVAKLDIENDLISDWVDAGVIEIK